MTRPKTSEAALLEQYRVALENAENQPQIAAALAAVGYDAGVITQGKDLLAQTRTAYDTNKTEDDETSAAYNDFKTKKQELAKTYATHRKKAKVVFRNQPVIAEQLAITGSLPGAYVTWLETVKKFYSAALADTDIQSALSTLKLNPDDLNAANAMVAQVEAARAEYLKEKGESQDATKNKDAAFAQMDSWMSDFYAVARIALEDHPQLLEALSKVVKS